MWFWRRFFSFSVLTVSFGLGLELEPLWTRTRTSLDLTRTRTSLDLDLSWTRQRWTWLQPYLRLILKHPFFNRANKGIILLSSYVSEEIDQWYFKQYVKHLPRYLNIQSNNLKWYELWLPNICYISQFFYNFSFTNNCLILSNLKLSIIKSVRSLKSFT